MEQFSEVTKHLQAAYIAGTGNPDIGPADGRMSRIGALIVETGGVQAFHQAQREANIAREETAPTVQKKSQRERKPSAVLLNASENPVLQNQSAKPVVAGNPDKGFTLSTTIPKGDAKQGKSVPPSNAVPVKNALAEMMQSEEAKAFQAAKSHDSEVLRELDAYLGQDVVEEHTNLTRILSPDEYEGKTPKYVADSFTLQQIEATLNALGIDFDPIKSAKQKAKILIDSIEGK